MSAPERTLPPRRGRRAEARRARRRQRLPLTLGPLLGIGVIAAAIVLVGLPVTNGSSVAARAQGTDAEPVEQVQTTDDPGHVLPPEDVVGPEAGDALDAEEQAALDDEAGADAAADVVGDAVSEDAEDVAETLPELVLLPGSEYGVYLARDPFDPVVPEPEPETDPATEGGTAPEGEGVVDPDDPAFEVLPEPSDRGCFGDDEVVCDGRVVTLVRAGSGDLQPDEADVRVDDEVHRVRRGEVFAGNFRVLGVDGGCVSLLYGDDGFLLCEGDRVLK
jgi:hypothetical protein